MATIHVITPITTKGIHVLDEIAYLAGPSLKFTHSILDQGPKSIESALDEAYAAPGVIKRGFEAQQAGANAVVINCMADPGLDATREVLKIPVFGPGQTSMRSAAMLGQRFSVITVLPSGKPTLENNARKYGLSKKLASIRVVNIPVLEIKERLDDVQKSLADEAVAAVEKDGAHVIVLGCTAFVGCADAIKGRLEAKGYHGVPVIDPLPHTVCIAEAFIKSGLTHSKLTYAMPPAGKFLNN